MMNEVEEIEANLKVAEHNLYVAKTHVQDRQEEVNRLKSKLEKLKPVFTDTGCACADPNGHCDCYGG